MQRLRRHNGHLSGGARYTKRKDKGSWRVACHVRFPCLKIARSFEQLWKKESNRATQWVALRGKPLVEKKRAALEKLLTRISDLCLFYWEVEKL
jgi:hypothetical protein